MRAAIAVDAERSYTDAAFQLGISQQGVSKRITKLEQLLQTKLFERVRGEVITTKAGVKFVELARKSIELADEALAAATASHVLRVAIHGEQIADGNFMRFYLANHPDAEVELVITSVTRTSRDAVIEGRVDAAFARADWTQNPLPSHIHSMSAYFDELHLLVSNDHALAKRHNVRFDELSQFNAWVPGAGFDTEVADYYRLLSAASGIQIDTNPHPSGIGFSQILDFVATNCEAATFGGSGTTTPWHPNIRRIPIVEPTPVYPIEFLWNEGVRTHSELKSLVTFIEQTWNRPTSQETWCPDTST